MQFLMIPPPIGFPTANPHNKIFHRTCGKAVEKLGGEACNRRKSIAFVQTAQLCINKIVNNINKLLKQPDRGLAGSSFHRGRVPRIPVYRHSLIWGTRKCPKREALRVPLSTFLTDRLRGEPKSLIGCNRKSSPPFAKREDGRDFWGQFSNR